VRDSRRYQLRLRPPLPEAVEDFASKRGLGLGPAIRQLIGRGLEVEERWADLPVAPADSPAALAALVASEHAVLMVASILPEGEQRMRALAARATRCAEERLALVREQPAAAEEAVR
jgi:hypothetical protein